MDSPVIVPQCKDLSIRVIELFSDDRIWIVRYDLSLPFSHHVSQRLFVR